MFLNYGVKLRLTYDMYFLNNIRVLELPVPGITIFIIHFKISSDPFNADIFLNDSFIARNTDIFMY